MILFYLFSFLFYILLIREIFFKIGTLQILPFFLLFVSYSITVIAPILSNILVSIGYSNPFYVLGNYSLGFLVFMFLCNLFFGFGLTYNLKNSKSVLVVSAKKTQTWIIILILISSLISFFFLGITSGLGLISFNLIVSCLLYLIASTNNLKKILLVYFMLCIYIVSITGVFFIVLWNSFLLLIILSQNKKIGFSKVLLIFLLLITLVGTIQLSKPVLRYGLANGENFISIVKTLKNDQMFSMVDGFAFMILRADHSKYISQVIDHVPDFQQFEYGRTYLISFLSVFLPDSIINNDAGGDGKRFVCKYIGDCRDKETGSYNIGLFGEAYVNFGYFSIIFLFLAGRLYNKIFNFFISLYENKSINGIYFCIYFACFFTLENDSTAFFKLLGYGLLVIFILNYLLRISFKDTIN